ncbi:hypothetical protein [Pseudomonas sp. TUM22785]|uniref:hypothetical protein n=1 Tax=Pseudomonas sp. TUM22785 TaxID=3019098 RepID=UPI0023068616|nr:hypothetical protein [Pseudomonas sp. TUM22785]WCD79191.1 hypothetical protein PI990_24840 [Pseudomonas sp. TUM22785]
MQDIRLLAAQAALTKLFSDSYFSISAIDNICTMMGIKPNMSAHQVLRTLHCVEYSQMSPELLNAIPGLIHTILQSPSFDASRINVITDGQSLRLVKN